MFAKLGHIPALIPALQLRQVVARRRFAAAHANDNRKVPFAATARRFGREALVCRWRPTGPGGRLECHWSLEAAEGTSGDGAQLSDRRRRLPNSRRRVSVRPLPFLSPTTERKGKGRVPPRGGES